MPPITASLSFLAKLPLYAAEKPYTIIPPAERDDISDGDRSNVEVEAHDEIEITDIRDRLSEVKLETHGIECKGYQRETAELLEKYFGADRVVTWDLRKRNVIKYEKGTQWDYNDQRHTDGPAIMAHVDFTFDSGLTVINAYLNAQEKEKYLNGEYRIRLVNTWRPMVPVIEHQPLAFIDPGSVHPEQLVACDRIMCDQLGEVYLLEFHEDNKWYWLEHQTPSEPYLIVSWDSESDAKARYCPHLSFTNSRAPAGAPPRESVETRSIVITRKDEE
ncbi:hypothetical protein ACJZ2D_001094 [Fusarium nematophilum]